ncbi:MAG TPA: RecB-like helicase, partial [Epsilonproteobacteria bacterium]|nr:RecB-like helicase [Campylobacterota bacterium]
VILLDKLTRKNADKSALLYHYNDKLYIDKILYRTKGRENFDENYANIIEERKVSSAKDSMNVLYVALTRAAEGLIVIRKPKDSIFDALGMEVMRLGELKTVGVNPCVDPQTVEAESNILLRNYGTQETPTQEEEEKKDYEAILFGTALHYALEMLGSFDSASLLFAMMAVKNRYGQQLTQAHLNEIENRVRMLIEDEKFQMLLVGAKVRKEQALSFEGELKQIDLLLEYKDSNLVIDYKSSKKYSLKHQKQVGYYRKAIANITGKRTEGMIIYLTNEGISLLNLK